MSEVKQQLLDLFGITEEELEYIKRRQTYLSVDTRVDAAFNGLYNDGGAKQIQEEVDAFVGMFEGKLPPTFEYIIKNKRENPVDEAGYYQKLMRTYNAFPNLHS